MNKQTTTTTIDHVTFADVIIGSAPYDVWNGELGYDTRPYVDCRSIDGKQGHLALPVAYDEGFADNSHRGGFREAGDVIGFLSTLPVGAVITVPYYYGCNYEGEESYILAPNGWLRHE